MSRTVLMNGVALLRMYSLGSIKWFMFPSSHHIHTDQSKAARYNKVCTLKLRVIYYEFFSLFIFVFHSCVWWMNMCFARYVLKRLSMKSTYRIDWSCQHASVIAYTYIEILYTYVVRCIWMIIEQWLMLIRWTHTRYVFFLEPAGFRVIIEMH